jgi:hypothetical protein
LVGLIHWEFSDETGKLWTLLADPEVELYFLSASVPPYVHNAGIPLSLLRQKWLFLDWMTSNVTTWEQHVIETLFNRYQLWYKVTSGTSKYTSLLTSGANFPEPMSICWIGLWLSDMDGLLQRKDITTKYTVNCYDLATLSYAIITLGASDYSAIRMKYVQPYGYIKETKLIGRGWSNNPLFTNKKDIKVADTDSQRKPFRNHLFLAQHSLSLEGESTTWVLDTCCGPEAGLTELPNYIEHSIDRNPNLYGSGKQMMRPGNICDVADGPGVLGFAPSLYESTRLALFIQHHTRLS